MLFPPFTSLGPVLSRQGRPHAIRAAEGGFGGLHEPAGIDSGESVLSQVQLQCCSGQIHGQEVRLFVLAPTGFVYTFFVAIYVHSIQV